MTSWRKKQQILQQEIDEWAFDGFNDLSTRRDMNDCTLDGNVTAQRLLKSQLLELSRERHRANAQLDYDRDIFLRKQAGKRTLPDLFRKVPLDPNEVERLQLKLKVTRRSATAPSPPRQAFLTELPYRPNTSPEGLAERSLYTGPISIASGSLILAAATSDIPLHERRSVRDERYRGLVKLFSPADPLKNPDEIQRVIDSKDSLQIKRIDKSLQSFVKDFIRQKGLTFLS